jgi:dipeptidyl aminopeptidase/acylaminoacyl peptidase
MVRWMAVLAAVVVLLVGVGVVVGGSGGHGGGKHPPIVDVGGGDRARASAGLIAFVRSDGSLWVVNPRRSSVHRITGPEGPNFPVWSPTGDRLAWECQSAEDTGASQLCVADSDGRNLRRYEGTYDTVSLLQPAWSHGGTQILLDGGSFAPDGSVAWEQHACDGGPPCLSPLLITSASGRTREQDAACPAYPRFSPDGRRLAYVDTCDDPIEQLKVFVQSRGVEHRVASRRTTRASEGCFESCAPGEEADTAAGTFDYVSWSPDGRFITYAAGGRRGWDVYVARAAGGRPRRLTHDHMSYYPSFSPDGRMIVFQSKRAGSYDIWVMDTHGHHVRRPTTWSTLAETKPAWCCSTENIQP